MADFVNNAFWYTVWDAKSGDLLGQRHGCHVRPAAGLRQRKFFCRFRLPLAQGRQAARQVHLSAGAHPAQRGGQPDATPEKGAP